jgi:nicotinate-nucleotide adenylyltransferase
MAGMSRRGIFGGTFDPPHLGHLILAAEARWQLGLDEVLFVLTADPPHKQHRVILDAEMRLEMVQAAIDGQPGFASSRVEIDRPGPHYVIDSIELLRKEYPGDELVYLIGGDSLDSLPTWHRPPDLLSAIDALGVMRRPGDEIDLVDLLAELPTLGEKLEFIDAPLLEIASREIRERVASGGHYRYYLPPKVFELIQSRGLYLDQD